MAVLATDDKTELHRGHLLGPDGTPEGEEVWMVMLDGTQMGNSTTNETEAMKLFNEAVVSQTNDKVTSTSAGDDCTSAATTTPRLYR